MKFQEDEYMRLEVMDNIEVDVTDLTGGKPVVHRTGFILNINLKEGNTRRGKSTITMVDKFPKDARRREEKIELPTPPLRNYLDLYSRTIIYVPKGEILSPDNNWKLTIRRSDKTTASSTH